MPFIPYVEIPSNPNLAPDTPLGQMVREAAKLANTINDQFPDWARPAPPILDPVGEGLSQLANDPRVKPVPLPPFAGGQCCGTTYAITYQYQTPGGLQQVTGSFTGKLGAPQIVSSGPGLLGANIPYTRCDGVTQFLAAWANVSIESYKDGSYSAIAIVSLEAVNGPDDCGDPLPVYPPVIPDTDDLDITIPIVIAPNLTIPINFVYIRPEVDVNIDADLNFNIPVTINLPDVNLSFGFDVGGVNINIGKGGGGVVLPTKPDPREPSPKPTPTGNGSDRDLLFVINQLRRIKEEVDDIKECACEPGTSVQAISYPADVARVINLPARTFLVRLTINQKPLNAKTQWGQGAPDVYYAGWASFGYANGGWEDRMPIDYLEKSFIPPRQPQSFSYTCYVGFTASLIVYYEVDEA